MPVPPLPIEKTTVPVVEEIRAVLARHNATLTGIRFEVPNSPGGIPIGLMEVTVRFLIEQQPLGSVMSRQEINRTS